MNFPFDLPLSAEFDAVGFGTNAVDYLIRVPEYPPFGSKVEFSACEQMAGGEIASTMAGLKRLGLKTAYIGRFGSDAAGSLGRQSLADAGVDISRTEIVPSAETQVAFILIDDKSGERTIVWKRDKKLGFGPNEAPVEAASGGRVLHMTPHDSEACVRMAAAAKSRKVIVSLDIDNIFEGVEHLLPKVDILISSAEFPERFLGIRDNYLALKEIALRYGCSVTGITLGAAGSLIYCNGEFIETAAFAPPGGCKDTTGAGDAFRTGFLFGLLQGSTVEDCAIYANAVAALKCREFGARKGLPEKTVLNLFLKNYRLAS